MVLPRQPLNARLSGMTSALTQARNIIGQGQLPAFKAYLDGKGGCREGEQYQECGEVWDSVRVWEW
jgi:hypothetical protein